MAQDITLLNAQYSDVPAVTLPKTGGGTASFTDVTPTTATASDVASGKLFYNASGVLTTGTASGGGGSSYTLLETKEFTVSTTSTSSTEISGGEFSVTRSNHKNKILLIQVRDKAGKRNGYFFGCDTYWLQPVGGATNNNYRMITVFKTNSSGKVESVSTSTYGIFPSSPPTFSMSSVTIKMMSRYSNSYTGTINGTYVVKVYDLQFPDNVTPFA